MLSDADLVPIELARQMSPQQRLKMALELSTIAIRNARQAIAEANPHLDEQEVNLLWVEDAYGKDLATRYRDYLAKRKKEAPDDSVAAKAWKELEGNRP